MRSAGLDRPVGERGTNVARLPVGRYQVALELLFFLVLPHDLLMYAVLSDLSEEREEERS